MVIHWLHGQRLSTSDASRLAGPLAAAAISVREPGLEHTPRRVLDRDAVKTSRVRESRNVNRPARYAWLQLPSKSPAVATIPESARNIENSEKAHRLRLFESVRERWFIEEGAFSVSSGLKGSTGNGR